MRNDVRSLSGIADFTRVPNRALNSCSSAFMDFHLTRERIQNLTAHPVDIASAERRDYVALARAECDSRGGGLFAGEINYKQIKNVGVIESRKEVVEEIAQPRVAMRLKDRDHAALERGANRGKRRADLGRMMRIVVEHDSSCRLALDLEAAADSAKPGQRGCGPFETDSNFHRDRNRGERIQSDVNSGRGDRHGAEAVIFSGDLEAR